MGFIADKWQFMSPTSSDMGIQRSCEIAVSVQLDRCERLESIDKAREEIISSVAMYKGAPMKPNF